MVLHHFEYTAEMCDCRYCPYYRGKRKCTADSCPCIEERILAGAASRSEVMSETMKDIHNAAFRKRLIQFIRESEELPMNFRNEKHRLAFDEAVRKLNKKNFAMMAAIYLLTAEHRLWMQIKRFVERNEIKFDSFKPRNSTENGYALLCCAKDLYLGTKHITISDLAESAFTKTNSSDNEVFYCFRDRELEEWFNITREEILKVLSSVCREARIRELHFMRRKYYRGW